MNRGAGPSFFFLSSVSGLHLPKESLHFIPFYKIISSPVDKFDNCLGLSGSGQISLLNSL